MADNHDGSAFTTKTSYQIDGLESGHEPTPLEEMIPAEMPSPASEMESPEQAPVSAAADDGLFINNLETPAPSLDDTDGLIFGPQNDITGRHFGDELVVGEGFADIAGQVFSDGLILDDSSYETMLTGDGSDLVAGGAGHDALEVYGTDWNVHINGVGDMSMDEFINSDYSSGGQALSGYIWNGGEETPAEDPESTLINFSNVEEINFLDSDSGV